MTEPRTNLEAAIAYARRGWFVFPVTPFRPGVQIGSDEYRKAKAPVTWLVPRGHLDATTDEAVITEWWQRVPRARVGLDCRRSGLLVVDFDEYKENAAQLPDLPPTLTAVTPQGGKHFFFNRPDGDWTDRRECGLDLKGNGYVILASPEAGGYEWADWTLPAPVPLSPELRDALLKPEEAGPGPQSLEEIDRRERFLVEEAQLRNLGPYQVKGEDAVGRVLVTLERCPFDPADHSAPFKAYIGIGSKGEPMAGCVVAGCAGKNWHDLPAPDYGQLEWEELAPPVRPGVREWRGDELATAELPEISFLPVFGAADYIPLGFSTIIGAQPKGGKTTLMQHVMAEWLALGHRILYLTEESENLWKPRLIGDPASWRNLTLLPVYAEGATREYMLERVRLGDENIVIVDTARAVVQWSDENAATEVESTLRPWMTATRSRGKTFIAVHHAKKGGGPLLEALAGSHSLVGAFDQVLVLRRDEVTADQRRAGERPNRNRRWLSGWGRFGGVPHMSYEMVAGRLQLEGQYDTLPFGDGE